MSKFTELTFASADERRPVAKKLTKYLPADAANLLAGIQRSNLSESVPTPETRVAAEGTPGEQRISVLPRLRVLVPLVEPNVLNMARNYSVMIKHWTKNAEDGAFTVEWKTAADHANAYRKAYEHYLDHHEVVREIGNGSSTDSWHSPMLLVPVRHTYADGTKPVTTLMAADGAARVWGARLALATDLNNWHVNKEWSDPAAQWSLTMAAARDHVAAARINSRVTGVLASGSAETGTPGWARSEGSIEDWADVLLPEPGMTLTDLATYLYHVHNTRPADERERLFPEDVEDWVASVDVFSGRDPFDLMSLSPASAEDREEVTNREQEVREGLLTVTSNKDQTARRVTLAACAMRQTAPRPGFGDESHIRVFSTWVQVALSKTRRLDWQAHKAVLGLIRDLTSVRSLPDCDLYGISLDLDNRDLYPPLNDPTSDWFTVTALGALTYAVLHGHLLGEDIPYSEAYTAASRAESAAYDAAYESAEADAEARGLTGKDADKFIDEATAGLPSLTETDEFTAEIIDRIHFARFPDQVLDRLLGTPEGHQVVLAYAEHAAAGTIPDNLFRYRVERGVQRVDLLAPAEPAAPVR